MLRASEARERTSKARQKTLDEVIGPISRGVQDAMSRGFYSIEVQGTMIPQHLHHQFKTYLESLGYQVVHYTGDQREPADEWRVSW